MSTPIQITVNGELREISEGLAVPALLAQLGLPENRVAIERNLEILPRSAWGTTTVQPGDRYEIVHLVGGG